VTDATTSLDVLIPKLEVHLSTSSGGAVKVLGVRPLLGGACQDNLRIDAEVDGVATTWVLRADAAQSLVGSLNRRAEQAVIQAAAAASVMTPEARWPVENLLRDGSSAYFMDWREGVAIGRKVVRDESLAAARAALPNQLAKELSRIHGITPESNPELVDVLGPAPAEPAHGVLVTAREALDADPHGRPGLEYALRWLEAHQPSSEVCLVHGDFRTGNFLVTPEGLSAVLDWEFAHWGSPAEDLAWLCVRDWRFGNLKLPVGGFARREVFLSAYQAASGRDLDPSVLHYWEVAGNVRWAAGCLQQGRRYLAGEKDLELLAISRRAIEMEYEALRLIEKGAS
jgi:aminoglycoside phosphotransferase (APT) family kinase protein